MITDNTAYIIMVKRAASFGNGASPRAVTLHKAAQDAAVPTTTVPQTSFVDDATATFGRVRDWYGTQDDMKKTMIRGLVGAAAGGITSYALAKGNRDPDDRRSVMGPTLMGALLGGTGLAMTFGGLDVVKGKKPPPKKGISFDPLGFIQRRVENNPWTAGLTAVATTRAVPAMDAYRKGIQDGNGLRGALTRKNVHFADFSGTPLNATPAAAAHNAARHIQSTNQPRKGALGAIAAAIITGQAVDAIRRSKRNK